MNDAVNSNPPSPEAGSTPSDKPVATEAHKAVPAVTAKEALATDPIPPGRIGQIILDAGLTIEPLGFDAIGTEMVRARTDEWLAVAAHLARHHRFDLLVSVAGVDWKTHREAVYHLYSTDTYAKLAVKVIAEQDVIPSVWDIWPAADWHERETYDLFGITFEGHPSLTRILMPDDWVGYPLRKDYKENDPRLIWNRR